MVKCGRIVSLVCVFLCLGRQLQFGDAKKAAAAKGPHQHQGLVKPYASGNPDIHLTSKQRSTLDGGDLVQDRLDVDAGGGRALAVHDVHSPPEYVWDRILDFPSYPKMVPKVSDCYNYYTDNLQNNTNIIKTRLKLNVFGIKFDNYIYHTHYPDESSMTWTLDYDRKSTLDDSVGMWYVEKHPSVDKPDWSRVYYSCALRVPSWVPGLVINYLNKKAIKEATTWVKRESEGQYSSDLSKGRPLLGAVKKEEKPLQGLFGADGGGPRWGRFGKKQPEQAPPPPIIVVEEEEEEEEPRYSVLDAMRKATVTSGCCYGAWRLAGMIGSRLGGKADEPEQA